QNGTQCTQYTQKLRNTHTIATNMGWEYRICTKYTQKQYKYTQNCTKSHKNTENYTIFTQNSHNSHKIHQKTHIFYKYHTKHTKKNSSSIINQQSKKTFTAQNTHQNQ